MTDSERIAQLEKTVKSLAQELAATKRELETTKSNAQGHLESCNFFIQRLIAHTNMQPAPGTRFEFPNRVKL